VKALKFQNLFSLVSLSIALIVVDPRKPQVHSHLCGALAINRISFTRAIDAPPRLQTLKKPLMQVHNIDGQQAANSCSSVSVTSTRVLLRTSAKRSEEVRTVHLGHLEVAML